MRIFLLLFVEDSSKGEGLAASGKGETVPAAFPGEKREKRRADHVLKRLRGLIACMRLPRGRDICEVIRAEVW